MAMGSKACKILAMLQIKGLIRNLLRIEFSSFVALFSALTFLCVVFYTFHSRYILGFQEIYVLGIVFLAALCSAGALLASSPRKTAEFEWKELALPALIFLFGLALGLYRLDAFSLWLDEELQGFAARNWPGSSIVRRAAANQQLPLGYYFTTLNLDLLGGNEWGLRLFSCFFAAGSGVLFYRLAKRTCQNAMIRTVAPFIYLLGPWVIRYAQEGRPYAGILFFGLLWMNAVYELFMSEEEAGHLAGPALTLAACSLLFLFSAAFQPVIFCGTFLAVLGWLVLYPKWRRKTVMFGVVVAFAALAAVPTTLLARNSSLHYFHSAAAWSAQWQPLKVFSSLLTYTNLLFQGQAAFLALAIAFAPFVLGRPSRHHNGPLWIGLAGCLVFGLFFLAPFFLLINYPIFARYYLIAYPLGLLVICSYFDHLSSFFDKGRDRYLMWGWQAIFLAALVAPQLRSLPEVYHSRKFDHWNVDYKSIFHAFREHGRPGDVGYVIPYISPGSWEQGGFLTTLYYYRENSPVKVTENWEVGFGKTVSDLIYADLSPPKPQAVFLAFTDLRGAEQPIWQYCADFPDADPFQGELYALCRVPVKGRLSSTLEAFFSGLVRALPEKEKTYRMFDILLYLAEYEKNPAKCRSYLSELKKLGPQYELIRKIVQTHESRCQALAR